jgi:hypothetical protein
VRTIPEPPCSILAPCSLACSWVEAVEEGLRQESGIGRLPRADVDRGHARRIRDRGNPNSHGPIILRKPTRTRHERTSLCQVHNGPMDHSAWRPTSTALPDLDLAMLVGLSESDARSVVEQAGGTLRAVPPGRAIHMDLRDNRVTVDLDSDGVVTRARGIG